MANEMTSHGFDDFLNELDKKITVANRRKINKAGADVYENQCNGSWTNTAGQWFT